MDVARTGKTSHPILKDSMVARAINRYTGSTIGFWDVGQLPETVIDLFVALENQLPVAQAGVEKIKATQDNIRRQWRQGRTH